MSDAAKAIASFERSHGLRIVVHDLGNWWSLPARQGIHGHDCCQQVKQTAHGWRCYDFEVSEFRAQWQRWPKGRVHRCHAGVVEFILPLVWEKELIGVLFAGQMRGASNTCDVLSPSTLANEIWAKVPLRELVDSQEAQHLLEQLRQLGARLLLLRDVHAKKGPPLREREIELFFLTRYTESDLGIHDLARKLKLSESRLAHVIKESFGQTFVQLLTHTRLRRACELLVKTDFPISQIALQVGYGDLSHFHRVFKKHREVTPRTYRVQNRNPSSHS